MKVRNNMAEKNRSSKSLWKKLGLITGIVIAAAVGYSQFGEALTLENLAAQEAELKAFQQKHPLMVYGVAFAIYVAVTGLSLPGATVLTLTCGWFFGLPRGFVLVSFASTTGATVAFLVSRYLLREPIQNRFGERLKTFNQSLEREGAFYLFMLRLIPAVPFFVINVVMGLTPIRARTFWWVSQLGMLPGTAVYVYAGASVPELATLAEQGVSGILSPQLMVAFVLLGVMPLLLRKLVRWIRPNSTLRIVQDDNDSIEIDRDTKCAASEVENTDSHQIQGTS
ncbi:TVP38/TMEM64 family protein [Rubinisphaera italica]|nr:TVP38/TMEM64 family protein [Rubinisphaera italica]